VLTDKRLSGSPFLHTNLLFLRNAKLMASLRINGLGVQFLFSPANGSAIGLP
jgi:hypothetical protein